MVALYILALILNYTTLQLDLSNQEQVLDDFISTLESTLSQLQQVIAQSQHTVMH